MSTLTHCYILNWLYHIEYLLNCCLINPVIFNSCALNSNLAKLILFKIFTKEVTLTDDKAQIVDIPINSIAGYTAYCLNFCAFNGHVVSTCLSISAISESVRGTVRSDTNVTCSVRAAIIYIKQL